jgi:hypothetical protein
VKFRNKEKSYGTNVDFGSSHAVGPWQLYFGEESYLNAGVVEDNTHGRELARYRLVLEFEMDYSESDLLAEGAENPLEYPPPGIALYGSVFRGNSEVLQLGLQADGSNAFAEIGRIKVTGGVTEITLTNPAPENNGQAITKLTLKFGSSHEYQFDATVSGKVVTIPSQIKYGLVNGSADEFNTAVEQEWIDFAALRP